MPIKLDVVFMPRHVADVGDIAHWVQTPGDAEPSAPRIMVASSLIGKPWAAGAAGPDAFSCWGLVRTYASAVLGLQMPDVRVEEADDSQSPAIARAAAAGGWRRVAAPPAEDDIALLRNPVNGRRHVGVLLRANGSLGMLHSEGCVEQPTPGVVFEPLAAVLGRYHALELWRSHR